MWRSGLVRSAERPIRFVAELLSSIPRFDGVPHDPAATRSYGAKVGLTCQSAFPNGSLTAFESSKAYTQAKWKQTAGDDVIGKEATVEPTTASAWASNSADWNALIGGYLPQLKRFARRHLPAQLDGTITPDDLVQEVVLSGLRQLSRLELPHEQAFLSYLLTSIRHRIVDEVRRKRHQPAFVLDDDGNRSADRGVSPLQRLISRESLRTYAQALAGLADRDRQLIVLRLVRGLSCMDVAVRLGMPSDAAVRMAVRRALRRLKKRLDQARTVPNRIDRCGASRRTCGLQVGSGVTGPNGALVVVEGDKPFETDNKLASDLRPRTP